MSYDAARRKYTDDPLRPRGWDAWTRTWAATPLNSTSGVTSSCCASRRPARHGARRGATPGVARLGRRAEHPRVRRSSRTRSLGASTCHVGRCRARRHCAGRWRIRAPASDQRLASSRQRCPPRDRGLDAPRGAGRAPSTSRRLAPAHQPRSVAHPRLARALPAGVALRARTMLYLKERRTSSRVAWHAHRGSRPAGRPPRWRPTMAACPSSSHASSADPGVRATERSASRSFARRHVCTNAAHAAQSKPTRRRSRRRALGRCAPARLRSAARIGQPSDARRCLRSASDRRAWRAARAGAGTRLRLARSRVHRRLPRAPGVIADASRGGAQRLPLRRLRAAASQRRAVRIELMQPRPSGSRCASGPRVQPRAHGAMRAPCRRHRPRVGHRHGALRRRGSRAWRICTRPMRAAAPPSARCV